MRYKIRTILPLLLFIWGSNLYGSGRHTKILTAEEMRMDYQIFQSIFEKANAGLYKYHTKEQLDSSFLANYNRINDSTDYRAFYNLIWNTVDYSGSCHNALDYESQRIDYIIDEKKVFPLPLKALGVRIYANANCQEISVGDELVTINGYSTKEFIAKTGRYISTDGHNKTGKYAFINSDWFPYYVYLGLGELDQFEITYERQGEIKKTIINAVTYNSYLDTDETKHSIPFDERKQEDYSFEFLDTANTGLLTVTTFSLGGPKSKGHLAFKAFIDSVCIYLNDKKNANLIVDIRGNGGGQDPNDLLLYSYLTEREFYENTTAFTLFNKVPYKKYFEKYYFFEKHLLGATLRLEHSDYKEGKYFQKKKRNSVWLPNKNAFHGDVILLIDPFVASAASLFGSLLKSDEHTVVIGEESCGGYYGHTGHIPVAYTLPNSRLILNFSIVDLEQDVKYLSDQKKGDGIIPDFKVIQTHADFLNQIDTQLNYAIQYSISK